MTSLAALVTPITEAIIKSSIILCLTFLATLALRRQSAAMRHTVWTVGLLSALALPMFSSVLPAWNVSPIRAVPYAKPLFATQPVATQPGPATVVPQATAPAPPRRITTQRILLLFWLMGILAVTSLLLREAIRLALVAGGASTVRQASWRSLVRDVSNALRLKRPVRLLRNPNASVLGTWGALRPHVLLPCESETWSIERMRLVLGHELAHVKRNDWLVQVIAEMARAIYWFNPLFWIACTHLRKESEHACDDTAMRLGAELGIDGPTYAGHVLDLARTLKHSAQPTTAALAMASTSNLERRLIAMLNPSLNRRATGKGTAVIVTVLAAALTLPLAAVSSQAYVPMTSVVEAVEFVQQTPIAAIPAVTATPAIAQRTLPRTVASAATASPVAFSQAIPAAAAQNPTGTLSGTISDATGAVIPGVTINVTAQSSGLTRRTLSNTVGNFAFAELPSDNYSVTASLPGFQQAKLSYVLRDPESSARLNFTLQLAPVFTVVEIATQFPPGLKCISIFGAFKADGRPFTEADCPGGTLFIAPPKPPVAVVPESSTPEVVSVNSLPDPVPAAGQRPIRVGGLVQAANLVSHPNPSYPQEARSKGIQGKVIISGVISEDGHLGSLKIISSSNPLLETSVLETLQNWLYQPPLLNGVPMKELTTITLNFTLGR